MKATLTNYHQPPRKVRLVANLVRGKSVSTAKVALAFLDKKSAPALVKLLDSAVSNARFADESIDIDSLFIKSLTVDKGTTLKRVRPFKQGRAGRLHKIMSTVRLELGNRSGGSEAKKAVVAKTIKTASTKVSKTTVKPVAKPRVQKAAKKTTK